MKCRGIRFQKVKLSLTRREDKLMTIFISKLMNGIVELLMFLSFLLSLGINLDQKKVGFDWIGLKKVEIAEETITTDHSGY